jgi:hypothetical protein
VACSKDTTTHRYPKYGIDLVVDRLSQYAQAPNDKGLLMQAKLLKVLGGAIDMAYVAKRLADEGGDISLISGGTDG